LQDNIQSEITDIVFGVWIIFFECVISAEKLEITASRLFCEIKYIELLGKMDFWALGPCM
jgi:hypothetical protein